MSEESCFAYMPGMNGKWMCKSLNRDCDGHDEKCSFYMTDDAAFKSREAALMRLMSLPLAQQKYIADVYYQGMMPWTKYEKQQQDLTKMINQLIGGVQDAQDKPK